ncbi:hypothetical protein CAPTEDRAFT_188940 [Capitella teleta]|uniref:G-protein coupled receptors family 1 profile domain-containing protein n=1 Tax=Capitella teleta TaxID=283909 RepID=R7UBA5_CAPTE|nr:hypothetical protein CAPTEDRAFT_188940 [Capitella teleta]|eukprot:ELU03391.1 hypothetical protein CAPTEDRAFT_188940 [Capitella teleta]
MTEEPSTPWPEIVSANIRHNSKSSSVDLDTCTWYNITIRVIFGGFLVCFGMIGNGLTMVIMGKERHKSSTIRMLFYLAIVDSFILIVYGTMAIPIPVLSLLGMGRVAHNMQTVSISTLAYVGQMLNQMSIFFTTIVTWQRYVSVCIPLKAKKYTSTRVTNAMTIASVVFSIAFYLPNFFQSELVTSNGTISTVTVDFAQSSSYQMFYSVVLQYLLSYILPMIALGSMGFSLVKSLRQAKVMNVNFTKTARVREELTLSIIIVVIIFGFCQSIGPSRRILMWIFVPYPRAVRCGGPLFFFGPWVLISLIINSTVNFIIYILCARAFRRKVQRLLCGINEVGPEIPSSQMTALDRSRVLTSVI